jgi:undecaprenyl-diphosphatase
MQFDSNLFLALNRIHSPWWDSAMLLFTRKETWLIFYLMLIVVIFRNYERKAWLILVVMILGVTASDQITNVIKMLTERLRPGHEPAISDMVHIVLRKGGLYGFVSAHASNSIFVLVFTKSLFRNRASFFALLMWTLLVSYSRIYGGNHYPLDILGGWILGIFLGVLFYRLLIFTETRFFISRIPSLRKTPLRRSNGNLILLTMITITVTLLLVVEIFHKYDALP